MSPADLDRAERLRRFRHAYALHRQAEGRGTGGLAEQLALPDLRAGRQARQWQIRRRTYRRFVAAVLQPYARDVAPRPVHVVDLGAGNGWLCYRIAQLGHEAVAVDVRCDAVDGLGAATPYATHLARMFPRVAASFDQLPLAQGRFDLAVFNASIHYAQDLARVLAEAARVVRPGGVIVILDSPFYPNESHGDAMVEEKHREAATRFGDRAADLMALQCIEYLTPERLATASRPMGLTWQRRRVWYPLRYELRPILSALAGNRRPSRFDLWLARRP